MALSTRSLATIEHAARRAARLLDGVATPVILGIGVELGAHGAVRRVTVGEGGPSSRDYQFWDLDVATITDAMIDAVDAARSPRKWWRID